MNIPYRPLAIGLLALSFSALIRKRVAATTIHPSPTR